MTINLYMKVVSNGDELRIDYFIPIVDVTNFCVVAVKAVLL
jgi:hypothetical protein